MDNPIIGNVSPLKAYLKLDELYPSVPEEMLLRPYVSTFDMCAAPPESLPELLLPTTTAATLPECCRSSDVIADVLKRRKTLKHHSVPRSLSTPSGPSLGIQSSKQSSAPTSASPGAGRVAPTIQTVSSIRPSHQDASKSMTDTELLVGYESGAVCLWNLLRYAAFIGEQRRAAGVARSLRKAAASDAESDAAGGASSVVGDRDPFAALPAAAELLGYHDGGRVTCSAYHPELDVAVTGCVDGSLSVWDVHGRRIQQYAQLRLREGCAMPLYLPLIGEPTRDDEADADSRTREESFAHFARRRRLCGVAARAHAAPVTAVVVRKGFAVSGGADAAIRVWDVSSDTLGRVCLTERQRIPVVGRWVVCLRASETASVQSDDIVATDDAGFCTALRLHAAHAGGDPVTGAAHRLVVAAPGDRQRRAQEGRWRGSGSAAAHGSHASMTAPNPFDVSRQKRIAVTDRVHGERPLVQEIGGTPHLVDTVSHAITLRAIANDTLLVAIAYSPVVSLMDYATLSVLSHVTHPVLTADGARLARQEGSSVHQLESKRRRELVGWLGVSAGPSNVGDAQGGDDSGVRLLNASHDDRTRAHAEPLRFLDALFVSSRDCLLLLDSRSCVFLWELPTRSFVARVDLTTLALPQGGGQGLRRCGPYWATGLLPSARARPSAPPALVRRSLSSGEDRGEWTHAHPSSPDHDDERQATEDADSEGIPFLVIGNSDIRSFRIVEPGQPILEAAVHKEPVVGLGSAVPLPRPCSPREPWTGSPETASRAGRSLVRTLTEDTSLVSVSREGLMLCWDRLLHVTHVYDLRASMMDAPRERAGVTRSVAPCPLTGRRLPTTDVARPRGPLPPSQGTYSEVTAFLYHTAWRLAITGHDDGDVCFWSCEGEVTHLVARERRHGNTVTALAAQTVAGGGDAERSAEGVLVTGGFDGRIATWNHPTVTTRTAAPRIVKVVSFNEVLSLQFCCTDLRRGGAEGISGMTQEATPLERPPALLLVGDAAGDVHILSTRDYEIVRVIRASPGLTAVPHGRTVRTAVGTGVSKPIKLTNGAPLVGSFCPHEASIVAICVLAKSFVTCDEDGGLVRWLTPTSQVASRMHLHRDEKASVTSPQVDEEREPPIARRRIRPAEVTCALSVEAECFVVGTRSGWVYLFNCDEDALFPVGRYQHACEVTSLAILRPPDPPRPSDNTTVPLGSLVVGAANGTVTQLGFTSFFL